MAKSWRVQVWDNCFVVLNTHGDEVLTSQEYSSGTAARRGARAFCEAMAREFVLESHDSDKRESFNCPVEEAAAAPAPGDSVRRRFPPVPGVSRHAVNPHAG